MQVLATPLLLGNANLSCFSVSSYFVSLCSVYRWYQRVAMTHTHQKLFMKHHRLSAYECAGKFIVSKDSSPWTLKRATFAPTSS